MPVTGTPVKEAAMGERGEQSSTPGARAKRAAAAVLSACLVPALLAGCSLSRRRERLQPQDSTETGNPPVLDLARIALVIKRDEVHVVGERRAVQPGGVAIEVLRLAANTVARGDVAADGSFDVRVEGGLDESYAVRAVHPDTDEVSEPVIVSRGGASVGGTDGGTGPFSCEDLHQEITGRFGAFWPDVDGACETHADCMMVRPAETCPTTLCSAVAVPHAGRRAIEAGFTAIADTLCAQYQSEGCGASDPPLATCASGPSACIEGVCRDCTFASDPGAPGCDGTRCDRCAEPELTWSSMGPVIDTAHVIQNCTTYIEIPAVGEQCRTEIPCFDPETPEASAIAIENALGDFELQTALRVGTFFGAESPTQQGTQIRVGEGAIIISDTPCNGAVGCKDAPASARALLSTLERIAERRGPLCR